MATVFWDRKGVLMVEFMQQGTTIMSKCNANEKRNGQGHSEPEAGNANILSSSLSLFFPSFVRLIDVFNTLLLFSTLLSLL
jgi:hypothetical protein